MKKNTKGFTLIELLAVIVILAIIALIATPIVLNLINTARKGAAARSAEGIRYSAQTYYYAQLVENPNGSSAGKYGFGTTTGEGVTKYAKQFNFDGTEPTEGTVEISANGEVTGTDLKMGAYYCSFANTGSAKCDTSKVGALS